jgi:hypothetical protein
MDYISISSLIISGITAVGVVIHQIHLKNCSCFCVNSDCYKTPPSTPKTYDVIK